MRRVVVFCVVISALGWTAWTLFRKGGSPPPRAAFRIDRSGGIPVLHVRGDGKAKGRFHGEQFAAAIRRSLDRLRPADEGVAAFAIETCGARLAPALPSAYRAEIEGIAEGAGITFHEALFLNTRFELAAFGLVEGEPPACAGGVGPGPAVARVVDAPADALVVVHEDLDPPLVLFTLPGVAGGLAGVRGEAAATICPVPGGTPALNGLVWVLMLRLVLEKEPRDTLPARATGAASIAMRRSGGEAGSLNFSVAGAAWFPGGELSTTTSEMPPGSGTAIRSGSRPPEARRVCEERARALLSGEAGEGAQRGAGVLLLARRGGELLAAVVGDGERRETRVFPPR